MTWNELLNDKDLRALIDGVKAAASGQEADAALLVLADWFEDRGEPEKAALVRRVPEHREALCQAGRAVQTGINRLAGFLVACLAIPRLTGPTNRSGCGPQGTLARPREGLWALLTRLFRPGRRIEQARAAALSVSPERTARCR